MMTIFLDDLVFFGYHGLYASEKKLGAEFKVDIVAQYECLDFPINSLAQTIDYTILYEMIQERMKKPTELLETITMDFCINALKQLSMLEKIEIKITKINPPIKNLRGTVSVHFQMSRNDLK